MIVHPYYSRPDADELYLHYKAVSDFVNVPVMIYNNPFTTGVDAQPDLLAKLSLLPHIQYVKESSGDASRILRVILSSKGRLTLIVGNDNLALESFVAGAKGWVSGIANALPDICVALYRAAVVEGQYADAKKIYEAVFPLANLSETTGKFVQVCKKAVELVGRRAGQPRLPLQPLSGNILREVTDALRRAQEAQDIQATAA
jgi:4-hydroxy-tetrahydrodipicolinate synthase